MTKNCECIISHADVQLVSEFSRALKLLNAIVHEGLSYLPPAIQCTNESHR